MVLLFYYILSDRKVYTRLTREIDEHISQHGELDSSGLHKLPYLHAVVQEGLRLGTPFPGLPRVTPSNGLMLDGTFVPPDTVVSVPAYAQQISPSNFYPEPLKFSPERWLPGGLGPHSVLNPAALMSFSFGMID